jgi:hypothetical protein
MIRLKNILNELKLNDLVGNQYKYVIGSSEEKYIGENDKKYVLEMIEKSLKTYLYDDDFALNYLDGSQRKEYNSFFEREVLTPMLKKVDFTLNNFFVLDGDKVKWKFSSNDTRKMVDEIFRKNSKVPSDIKKEYYEYRLEYAGVKLKEGVNEETVHFKKELKNGNIFQVVDRDTTGMRGTQDKFKMQIVDKRGKVVKDLGSHPSLSGAEKFGNKFEVVNEASMPPVRKVVNAILKKHGIVPMKTTSTSVRGFHNIQRGGYRYEGDYFLGFYGVPQDIIDKVGAEMKAAGVKGVDVRKGIISADFTKTGLNEAKVKTPDFIVTSIPADAIPSTNISKADVGLGLAMFDALGRGWTLNNKDYKLDYHNGKVALVLTKQGKLAVRVKSGHDPKYVQKIEKFANDYLSKYAKDIKK